MSAAVSKETTARSRSIEIARRVIAALVILGAIWLFRTLDLRLLAATLRAADGRLIAAAIALNLGANLFARASRWRALLPDSPRTGRKPEVRALATMLLAAQAALNVFPFRAGEAVRVLEVQRRFGHPIAVLITAALAEKLIEAGTMGLYVIPATIGLPQVGGWLRARTVLLALGALLVLGAAIVLLARATARSASSIAARVRGRAGDVVRTLGDGRAALRATLWSIGSDGCDVLMILLVLRAVGIAQPFAAGCAILVAINVAIAIPSTPAQLGAFEAGAIFALGHLGVRPDAATAFALLYHACHIVPTTLIGGGLLLLARRRRSIAPPRASAPRPSLSPGIDPGSR